MKTVLQGSNHFSPTSSFDLEIYRSRTKTVLLLILLTSLLALVTEIIFSTPVGVHQGGYTEADLANIKNLETLRGISRTIELATIILIVCWFVVRNWGQHKQSLVKIITSELKPFVIAFVVLVLITVIANLFI